jgi:hypothetical protein
LKLLERKNWNLLEKRKLPIVDCAIPSNFLFLGEILPSYHFSLIQNLKWGWNAFNEGGEKQMGISTWDQTKMNGQCCTYNGRDAQGRIFIALGHLV